MSKKSRRSASQPQAKSSAAIHALRSGPKDAKWDPLNRDTRPEDERRDQSYVKNVAPRSDGQKQLIDAIDKYNLVMAIGPAGTGKTYLAISKAVEALAKGQVGRIILTRPAIEAGESLGFLPGDMEDKIAPYLKPLLDALTDRMGGRSMKTMLKNGEIEIAPVGFMRGRTLNNAFVVIDEAQNCTYMQIKMLLTRMGWHSTIVVTGDPDQSDLLPGMSGLAEISKKLEALESVGVVKLSEKDVVRHPLVAEMLSVI
ncbi:MAG: phosphate starvation-inducible protein PhoH [Rhodospirillaceae bacterium]|nr:MAG: phosphate starvation-inducible protein PhoH [Rhodospirillaceae bacterium]